MTKYLTVLLKRRAKKARLLSWRNWKHKITKQGTEHYRKYLNCSWACFNNLDSG